MNKGSSSSDRTDTNIDGSHFLQKNPLSLRHPKPAITNQTKNITSPSSSSAASKLPSSPASGSPYRKGNESQMPSSRKVEKATESTQTDSSLAPDVEAEFITYEEFMSMRNEKDELETLLNDSVATIDMLKEKYDSASEDNTNLKANVELLEVENKDLKTSVHRYEDLMKDTQSEFELARKLEHLIQGTIEEKGLPNDVIEISKAILRSEIEFNQMENKLVKSYKTLLESSLETLVEIDAEHDILLQSFPQVNFVKKEERDPYKGIPRRSQNGTPGYLFGSPSNRFPISPDLNEEGYGSEEETEHHEEHDQHEDHYHRHHQQHDEDVDLYDDLEDTI